jgi:hypothetical protein
MYRSELMVVSFELSAEESGGSPICDKRYKTLFSSSPMRRNYKLERLPLPSLFSLAYYPKILDKAGKEKRSSLFCRTVGDKE